MINKNNLINNQIENINLFIEQIKKWNGLDLIAKSTVKDIWYFHINEALSIEFLLRDIKVPVIDFGAGSGIIAYTLNALNIPVECVERNSSKMLFIQKIGNLKCCDKIQYPKYIAIVRGVDKIVKLLSLLKNADELILFKQVEYHDEINKALKMFNFNYNVYEREVPGSIIHIFNIKKIK